MPQSRFHHRSHGRPLSDQQWDSVRFLLFLGFLFLCFAGGGGSREDILSLLYLRPAAILCGTALLLIPGRFDPDPIRIPAALLLSFAVLMACQLIPLPPGIWLSLPAREPLAAAAEIAGVGQPWRPISILPELTLNSLWSLVVPAATLIGIASLGTRRLQALLPLLIAAIFASALLAVAQMAQGSESPLRYYRVTNDNMGVGLFANRNHQAALLVICFPMLAVWAAHAQGNSNTRRFRNILAIAFGLFLIPMILVTGSRAGLLLGILAISWSCFQYFMDVRGEHRGIGWKQFAVGLAAVAITGAVISYFSFERADAFRRLLESGLRGDDRFGNLPLFMEMIRATFPIGSGFGTFDPLYRMFEPYAALSPSYLNHAHNDLVELIIVGGIVALALLLAGLIWMAAMAVRAFRGWRPQDVEGAHARLGAVILVILLGWSLIDYPLRTPILSAVMVIAAGWLATGVRQKTALPEGIQLAKATA